MASIHRSQLRLDQISGSFFDREGGIVDTLAADTGAALLNISINSGSMVGVMSEVVSAIKRIHGAGTFAKAAAGEFSTGITPVTADAHALGSATKEWSDLYLADAGVAYFGSDQDVRLTHVADTGLLFSGSDGVTLQIRDSALSIGSDVDGQLDLKADAEVEITTAKLDVDASSDFSIRGGAASEVVTTSGALTLTGVTLDVDASGGAFNVAGTAASTVTTSGGTLTLDGQTGINIQENGTDIITVDSSQNVAVGLVSGKTVTIGHSTSETTVSDNLNVTGNATITGDLIVNGTTATLDVTNLNVEDPFIMMGDGAQSANNNTGVIFISGSSNGAARPDVAFARVANDVWGLGSIASNSGSITSATGMTHDVTMRHHKSEFGDANNYIYAADLGLMLSSSADIHINANGGDVKFYDNTQLGLHLDLAATAGDAVFKDAGGTEIFRIDGSADSLLMSAAKKIEFGDNATFIHQSSDGVLLVQADGTLSLEGGVVETDSPLTASAGAHFNGDGLANAVLFGAGADFQIEVSSDDALLGNVTPNKDVIFHVNSGSQPGRELARFDASAGTFAMKVSNAQGTNGGVISFNGVTDQNEAIYGDAGALYLRSNAVSYKMPTSDGASGEFLKTSGAGILSFGSAGDVTSARQQIISAAPSALVASGTALRSGGGLGVFDIVLGTVSKDECDNGMTVFVNGQMLLSGTVVNVGSGDADYHILDGSTAGRISLKLGFNLLLDDVVQVVLR